MRNLQIQYILFFSNKFTYFIIEVNFLSIRETDDMSLAAIQLLAEAWNKCLADKSNPFDEAIEHTWLAQRLF